MYMTKLKDMSFMVTKREVKGDWLNAAKTTSGAER
jgi:hypothetical protein